MKKDLPFWLFLLIVCGLFVIVGVAAWAANSRSEPVAVKSTITREELFDLTNKQRVDAGLNLLLLDPTLNDTAQGKCEEIIATRSADHDELKALATRLGYRVGENLVEGQTSAKQAVDAWMSSPKHRDNILRSNWKKTGFGICRSDDMGNIAVQHFSE